MQIKFCGAARNVTGSNHLVTLIDGTKILLDCGMFQGGEEEEQEDVNFERNKIWHYDPKEINILVLSHAHIDHTGRVPKLVKDGFNGKIYATHATRSLCAIMLLDSALIQEKDAEYHNTKILTKKQKRKQKATVEEPLYTQKDIAPVMEKFTTIGYDSWHHIHKDVQLMFIDAGHILGSAGLILKINENGVERTLGFTGDIGRPNRPILRDPQPLPPVEYLICESTYGDRVHETGPEQLDKLLEIITDTCIVNKGKLVIPAFSVGRTQEIVYMLDRLESIGKLPKVKVYVDSPLAVNATEIYGVHPECFDNDLNAYILKNEDAFGFNNLTYIKETEESKKLNTSNEPCIIISSSGMANAGRVKHHIANNVEKFNTTILIVGYASPGTPAAILKSGKETIKLFGEQLTVNAKIAIMDSFSAHGDKNEMYDHIKNQIPTLKKLFLVHGEYETQTNFKYFLQNKGFKDIEIPSEEQFFDL